VNHKSPECELVARITVTQNCTQRGVFAIENSNECSGSRKDVGFFFSPAECLVDF
jgi:hypothetical protein